MHYVTFTNTSLIFKARYALNYFWVGTATLITKRSRSCSASDSAYSYTFLHNVLCLSVVCHIRAPCLNRSTGLDAIRQMHLRRPMTHCVRWGPWPHPGEREIWGSNSQPKHAVAKKILYDLPGGSIDQEFRLTDKCVAVREIACGRAVPPKKGVENQNCCECTPGEVSAQDVKDQGQS